MNTIDRFISRIGKRIYRENSCPCEDCKKVPTEGLVVNDKQHADYLYVAECEMGYRYQDTPITI